MKELLIFIILLCPFTSYGQTTIDTDGDSIPDIDDTCPMTPGTIEMNGCQEPTYCSFSPLEFLFDKNSYSLTSKSSHNLKSITIFMKEKNAKFYVKGFASCDETKKLAKKRAKNVRNELIKNGVNKHKLKIKIIYSSNCNNTEIKPEVNFQIINYKKVSS
ncbi:hypothetical protein ETU09_00405 [Apibacter muscae]|uniref:OmpA-like domain-containing protein n=1 Tax=Apibacter muscae TaxID=2509004 RepID=A0A563DJW6_9FLAO|nr:OmpA family protein [Apibacter muscae]TWP30495.1 hypothetical protein ETU09_00405 [Apibacter muscae]